MDLTTYIWFTFAVFATLATFSFLYRDNPFYKFTEHLVVGVSAGYFVIILWHNSLVPNLFQRLADGDWYFLWLNSTAPWYIVPAILGCLMWTRFSKQYSWVSRWPMALYIGISTGVAIPLEMSNRVNKQLYAMMAEINWANFGGTGYLDTAAGFSQVIIFVGTFTALIYSFFSKAHSGAFGGMAKLRIWTLMIGFGASFGFTVMARISLFINRIQDINDWSLAGFNATETPNPDYSAGGFQFFFWLMVAGVVAFIVWELIQFARRPKESQA
jgi:hypothetical protein